MYDTPFIRQMHYITEPHTGNEASKLKVLLENGNHGRADSSRYVAHHHTYLSLKQHSTIQVVRIPHIVMKRKPLTKAGSTNILVHVVATYDAFQAVLGFLCCRVLGCLLDVHARADAFAVYNRVIRGYTENLVIRRTLFIERMIFYHDHL